jgi:hypothetical protein
MANVQVNFDRIEVDRDGDPGISDGQGDFYWSLSVNGTTVSSRSSGNVLRRGNGDVISLDASKSVELRPQQDLIVSGFLAEKDQGTSGADERDDFAHTFDRSQNWGNGPHQVALQDRKMDVTLHYTVTAG